MTAPLFYIATASNKIVCNATASLHRWFILQTATPLLLLCNKIISSVCCPLLLLHQQRYCFFTTLTFCVTISMLLLASLCYCFYILLLFLCYCLIVSFCFFYSSFAIWILRVFFVVGTTGSPSSPNTNVSASSPNMQSCFPLLWQQLLFPSQIHSRSSTSNSPIPIIYFGVCR